MLSNWASSRDTILQYLNIGMPKGDVLNVLKEASMTNVQTQDFPPGQNFSSKIFAQRGGWLSSWWGFRTDFHLYFDDKDALAKFGKVPLLHY